MIQPRIASTIVGMAVIALAILASVGCAETSPIEPASASKSHFAAAVYKGETVTTGTAKPGAEPYRVFMQGATGFVSIQSVRDDAEQRATQFCDRKGKTMESLSETVAKPPFILGNFPRVEIVFYCVDKVATNVSSTDDPKYRKLVDLKKLLDSGVLTQEEFEREKAKILSQP
jgi:hypothetical protein